MTSRARLSILLLLFAASVGVAVFVAREEEAPPVAARKGPEESLQFAKAIESIRAAERIPDALQRCLAVPDPPWLHWTPSVVGSYCRAINFGHISLDEIRSALEAHQADQIDRTFSTYLAENFEVADKHGILARTYRNLFNNSTAEVREIVKRWVADDPSSPYALAARGTYYQAAGASARGGEWARDTPEQNIENMHRLENLAIKDLREALRLEPRLIAAYEPLIDAARMNGARELIEESIRAALKVDPAEERIYRPWMRLSEPRWGGSEEAMTHVEQEAASHADRNPMLKTLAERRMGDMADHALNARDYKSALELYALGFAAGPSPTDMLSAGYAASMLDEHVKAVWYFTESFRFGGGRDALERRADELKILGRADLASEDLELAARGADKGNDIADARALIEAKRFTEAEAVFLAALRPNRRNKDALAGIITLYMSREGLNQPTKAEPFLDTLLQYYPDYPRAWLFVAAMATAKGEGERKCLESLKRYLALVEQDDPSEKAEIVRVKRRVAELEQEVSKKQE